MKNVDELLPFYERWYAKSRLLINDFNNVSQSLCIWTGFAVSIGEAMKKFKFIYILLKFWMKNKPLKEGYKLWEMQSTPGCKSWNRK